MSERRCAAARGLQRPDMPGAAAIAVPGAARRRQSGLVNGLTAFGLFAVTAMLLCYALEARSRWFVLGFAGACALGSAYGFLQGAWPFGLVEAIWAVVALRRYRARA